MAEQVLVSIDVNLLPTLVALLTERTRQLKVTANRLEGIGAVVYIEFNDDEL